MSCTVGCIYCVFKETKQSHALVGLFKAYFGVFWRLFLGHIKKHRGYILFAPPFPAANPPLIVLILFLSALKPHFQPVIGPTSAVSMATTSQCQEPHPQSNINIRTRCCMDLQLGQAPLLIPLRCFQV